MFSSTGNELQGVNVSPRVTNLLHVCITEAKTFFPLAARLPHSGAGMRRGGAANGEIRLRGSREVHQSGRGVFVRYNPGSKERREDRGECPRPARGDPNRAPRLTASVSDFFTGIKLNRLRLRELAGEAFQRLSGRHAVLARGGPVWDICRGQLRSRQREPERHRTSENLREPQRTPENVSTCDTIVASSKKTGVNVSEHCWKLFNDAHNTRES